MTAESNVCPDCGMELQANALVGHCPRCHLGQVMASDPPEADGTKDDLEATHISDSGSVPEQGSSISAAIPGTDPERSFEVNGLDPDSMPTNPTIEYIARVGQSEPRLAGDRRKQDPEQYTLIRFFGDYELQKELGRGGMGVVYKARQISLNRSVALKMIKAGLLADGEELRRFQNEAEAVARLDHAGIVPVYEVGECDGQRYFSMKLIEGSNLAEHLGSFFNDPRKAACLLAEIAAAVQHAHVRGILHRDLKPANVLIDGPGHPHITDFGLAKRMESDVEMTASGAILGTPAYMSPEQAAGLPGSITTATDVYGLGAILYSLLAGKPPFGGKNVFETLDAVRTRPPDPPTSRNPGIPRDLELICLKCLEKNPSDRYSTAAMLSDDLSRFIKGEPVSVRAAGAIERLAKWARRKPTLAAAYTFALLTLMFGGLGGLAAWQWRVAAEGRDFAAVARKTAEEARDSEKKARATAEQLQEKFERFEYGRTMEVAHQEWREGNVPAAIALIESTRDDLRGWEWRYIHRLCHSDLITFEGHSNDVNTAAFSPDGSRILTASNDETAKLWDARTGHEVLTLAGHTNFVSTAAFRFDGRQIVTASRDKTAKIWDAISGTELRTFKRHSDEVNSASFSGDGTRIVSSSIDGAVKIWNAETGREILALKKQSPGVCFASFSPDGSRVVVTNRASSAKVWDANTGAEVLKITSDFHTAVFSPDGLRLVTANWDQTAKVWNAKNGELLLTLTGHSHDLNCASFSSDGTRLVTGSRDMTAMVWDAETGARIITLKGHTRDVTSASFNGDGSQIVTASDDQTARLWDAGNDAEVRTFDCHTQSVEWTEFSPDGLRFVTASVDTTAKLWDANSGTEILTFKGHDSGVNFAAFSDDGSRVVTAGRDQTARIWNAKTGVEMRRLKGHKESVNCARFSPDGLRIVTASDDRTAKVWDARSGAELLTLDGHDDEVNSALFTPDGLQIVTASQDGTARVRDGASGTTSMILEGHGDGLHAVSISEDGSRIITGSSDNTAKVWEAKTGVELLTLKGHTEPVKSARFSPDGSRIITGSNDGTAKIWDANSGAEVLSIKEKSGVVASASFSSDGSRILTTGGGVKIRDSSPINRKFLTRQSTPTDDGRK